MEKVELTRKSIEIILQGQSPEGAYIACSNFPAYQYCWFRDGSFCALAMAEYGYIESVKRFLDWTAKVILRFEAKIVTCISKKQNGEDILESEFVHSRFTSTGEEVPGHWGFNQYDGLGLWLWTVCELIDRFPSLGNSDSLTKASELCAHYLAVLWNTACSDCWEEHEDGIHTYTLAAIEAGLIRYSEFTSQSEYRVIASTIDSFIMGHCVADGCFIKSIGMNMPDANLMGLCEPFCLVSWDDPIFQKTLSQIQTKLMTPGLHRYETDSYYGGGEWVLLSEWAGWLYAKHGRITDAEIVRHWAENLASSNGALPEQIAEHLFFPEMYTLWAKKCGKIAEPLLWSHAMYLLLAHEIEEVKANVINRSCFE